MIIFACISLLLRFLISLRGLNTILSIINRFFNKDIIRPLFFNEELCPNVCYCAGSDELNDKGESSKDSKSSKTSEG